MQASHSHCCVYYYYCYYYFNEHRFVISGPFSTDARALKQRRCEGRRRSIKCVTNRSSFDVTELDIKP